MTPHTSGNIPQITAVSLKVVELLSSSTFSVPWHQRRYDWDKDHVFELLEDLTEAMVSPKPGYFLGTIMLVQKGNSAFEVNDGQQRLMTISLICAKLLRIFQQHNEQGYVDKGSRILFVREEWDPPFNLVNFDNYQPRLVPSLTDKINFNTLIRGQDIEANGKLMLAWEEIDRFISKMSYEDTKSFFDFLAVGLEIACLYVPESIDANSVFETLNSRGKPLSNLDKIRNHIYSYFNSNGATVQRETIHDYLERTISSLRTPRSERKVEDYVRTFLQNEYGFLPSTSLYREMKKRVDENTHDLNSQGTRQYVYELVEEMSRGDLVQTFKSICNPNLNLELFEKFKQDATSTTRKLRRRATKRNLNEFLIEMHRYKVTYSLLFAILRCYLDANESDKKKIAVWGWKQMDALTSFVMRTALAAAKFEPSRVEKEFADMAKNISINSALTRISIVDALHRCDQLGVLNDETFKDVVTSRKFAEPAKARRFLLSIAHYQQSEVSLKNDSAYTLEHVLPKSERHLTGWKSFDDKSHAEYAVRLGNMVLLAEGDNKSSDSFNRNFNAKKPIFERSVVHWTKGITDYDCWTPAVIDQRQRELAELAAEVWTLPSV